MLKAGLKRINNLLDFGKYCALFLPSNGLSLIVIGLYSDRTRISEEGSMTTRLALVDDDQNILTSVSLMLEAEGYEVDTYFDSEQALSGLLRKPPALAILDIKMPRLDGTELLNKLRQRSAMRVIFLTSKDDELDEALGFGMGADDYITKPIKPRILNSKVKALLRRFKNDLGPVLSFDNLVIDSDKYNVKISNKTINLPRKEFELLFFLASKPNKVFKREKIMESVWGSDVIVGDRTIDVHIRKLREKIGENYFKTVKGVGYQFIIKQ